MPLVPSICLVVPVFNEEVQLESSVRAILGHCRTMGWKDVEVMVADNASTDRTAGIGRQLARTLAQVRYLRLERRGRGAALREAWLASKAEILGYMDVDLSTSLDCLESLLLPLIEIQADISIGSRRHPKSQVERGWKRSVISWVYQALLHATLRVQIRDAQCGFKALRRTVARELLPDIRNDGWFFDTELLVLAQDRGFRVTEVPVIWRDDLDTRVRLVSTVIEDLRGIARLRRERRMRNASSASRNIAIAPPQ